MRCRQPSQESKQPTLESLYVCSCGGAIRWNQYSGTRATLLALGIVSDGDFPGDPGQGKTASRCKSTYQGREIRIQIRTHASSRGPALYWMEIRQTQEEADADDARSRQSTAEFWERNRRDVARQEAKETMAAWPRNPGEYRSRVMALVTECAAVMRGALHGMGGYAMRGSIVETFEEAMSELFQMLPAADVRFSDTAKQVELIALQAVIAQADPMFVRFLDSVVGDANSQRQTS